MDDEAARLRTTIRSSLETRETQDLLEIWHKHDTDEWTDAAFNVLEDILHERLGEVPEPDPDYGKYPPPNEDEELLHPDFLHDTGRIFTISYWAKILSWVLLVLFLVDFVYLIVSNLGSISQPSDLLFFVGRATTLAVGLVYFVVLQAISQGLLALVDIAIDVSEMKTGTEWAAE
jgi:hypothetical protein